MDPDAERAYLDKEIDKLDARGGHDARLRQLLARYQELTEPERVKAARHSRVAQKLKDLKASLGETAVQALLDGRSAKDTLITLSGPPLDSSDYFWVSVYPELQQWNDIGDTIDLKRIPFRIPIAKWKPGALVKFGPVRAASLDLTHDHLGWILYCIEVCVNTEGYAGDRHDASYSIDHQLLTPAFMWNYGGGSYGFQDRRQEVLDWYAARQATKEGQKQTKTPPG